MLRTFPISPFATDASRQFGNDWFQKKLRNGSRFFFCRPVFFRPDSRSFSWPVYLSNDPRSLGFAIGSLFIAWRWTFANSRGWPYISSNDQSSSKYWLGSLKSWGIDERTECVRYDLRYAMRWQSLKATSWTLALKPAAKSGHFALSPSKGSSFSCGRLCVWCPIVLVSGWSIHPSELDIPDCFCRRVAIRSESVEVETNERSRLLLEVRYWSLNRTIGGTGTPITALLVLPVSSWHLLWFTGPSVRLLESIAASSCSRAARDCISRSRSNLSLDLITASSACSSSNSDILTCSVTSRRYDCAYTELLDVCERPSNDCDLTVTTLFISPERDWMYASIRWKHAITLLSSSHWYSSTSSFGSFVFRAVFIRVSSFCDAASSWRSSSTALLLPLSSHSVFNLEMSRA